MACTASHSMAGRAAREDYYKDVSTKPGKPNIHWQHDLDPIYNNRAPKDQERFAYPQAQDLKLHDPPTYKCPRCLFD